MGTYTGDIFKSTNSGESWQAIHTSLTNNRIHALAIDPLTPSTLYAGTYTGGVFKSINSGNSWQIINVGLTNTTVRAIAIDPFTPSTLYAGTYGGVFKSTNSGDSWQAIHTSLTNNRIYALAINPLNPSTLYAGNYYSGVFKSINSGDNWQAINTGLTNTYMKTLVVDPLTPSTLYASIKDGGIFKYTGDLENLPQCSDGEDNDGDGLVDINDPGCYTDGDVTNPSSYDSSDDNETDVIIDPNNSKPLINVNGQSVIVIAVGREYIDLGATASDDEDGDLTSKIIVSGLEEVSTDAPATYRITYNVIDSQGVPAETKVRDVVVGRYALPNSLPVITWVNEPGFEDGVHPNELFVGETVTAKLIYTDADNNYPRVYMWARGGNFGSMLQTDPTALPHLRDNNFMNGEQLMMSRIETYEDRYDYQFYINDNFNSTFYFPSSKQSLVVYDNTENYIPTDGTLIIRDDVIGGDCAQVGIWNADSKTCTFTSNYIGKIFIASSNIILDGAGYTHSAHESCEGYGNVYESILTTNRTNNVEIKNFTFKTCSFYAVDTRYASEWYIHNNNFYQVDNDALSSYGIYFYGRNNIRLNNGHRVHDNDFNLHYGVGISADYTSDISVLRNTFTDINHAINLTGQHGKTNIEDNIISDVGRGIYVEGASPEYFDGQVYIRNNTIQRASLNGIFVTRLNNSEIANNHLSNDGFNSSRAINLTDITDSIISNNTIEQVIGGGISLEGGNNIILGNRISDYAGNGIYVNGVENKVSENILSGGREDVKGIVINGDRQQVLNNYISKENDIVHASGYALSIGGSSHIVSGNYGNSDRGIYLYYANNTDVRLNSFVGITTNGLFLENSEDNTIYGNQTTGSVGRGTGIYIKDSNGNEISNHLVQNVNEGVHMLRSKNNTLSNNTIQNSVLHPFYYEIELPREENFTNTIVYNNFIGYSFPPYAKMSSISPDLSLGTLSGGNYWSEYDSVSEGCSNANNDAFCDSPYYFMSNWSNTVGDMRPYARENGWNSDIPVNNAPVISVIPGIVYHPEGVVFQYADKIVGVTAIDPDAVIDPEDVYFHISRFTIAGEVNHLVAGEYILSYDVSDSHGLAAETAYRTVIVEGDNPDPDPDYLPIVQTGIATNITDTSVKINGTINPNGLSAKAFFTYGETETSQNVIPVPFIEIGEGTTPVSVSETVTGLQPNTAYLYRVIGINVNNAVFGDYLEFTTLGEGGSEEKPESFSITSATAYCDTREPVGPAVKLEWEPSAGAQSYEVYRDDVKYATLPSSSTVFENNTGLVIGQEYEYFIRAINDNGFTNSNEVTVEILEGVCGTPENHPPNKPTNLLQGNIYDLIEEGGILNPGDIEPAVKFLGDVSDPDGDRVELYIELRNITDCNGTFQCDDWEPVIPDFNPISESQLVDSGSQAYAYANVTNGKYHWRARTVDEYGEISDWEYLINDKEFDFVAYENFSFVHMTDVHLGEHSLSGVEGGGSYKSYPRFTDGLYEIDENIKPDFILMGGDLVEWAKEEYLKDYQSFIEQYDIPVYNIPGNHDRYENDSVEETVIGELLERGTYNDDLVKFISIINSSEGVSVLFNENDDKYDEEKNVDYGINKYNYTFEHNGFLFIGLDSGENADIEAKDGPNFVGDEGPEGSGLSDLHMKKLKKLNPDIPKIIFIHHPIITGKKDDDCHLGICPDDNIIHEDASIVNNWEKFVEYCQEQENNVQLVLSGHTHKDVIFNKDKNKINNNLSNWDKTYPLFIQTRSATKDDYGYRVIKVVNGKVEPKEAVPTGDYKKIISDLDTNDDLNLDFKVNDNDVFSMTPEDITGLSTPYFIAKASEKVILYEDTQQSTLDIKNGNSSNIKYDLLLQKRDGDINVISGIIPKLFVVKLDYEWYDSINPFYDDFIVFRKNEDQNFTVLDFREININSNSEHKISIDWSVLEVPQGPIDEKKIKGLDFGIRDVGTSEYIFMDYTFLFKTVIIDLNSPGELQVYDNNGNVTGMVNGEIMEEIPYSLYVPETETVYVFSDEGEDAADNLRTQVVGFYEDTYDLSITVEEYDEEKGKFMADDIPTNGNTTHQFSIDWEALAQGEKGVTMEIDEDGNGEFEKTIVSDATLESLIANAGESYESTEGTAITFDASLSTDLDGSIVFYEWDFDGDGNYDESSTLPTIAYTYGDDYSGEVILRVTDDEGLTDVDTANVQIDNVNPEIETFSDRTIEVFDKFVFENNFTDAGWLDMHTASIEWGDGKVESTSLTEENEAPEARGKVTGSHTYNLPGIYTVILYITDDDGGVGINKFETTVEKRKTELTYTGDLNGQYSDQAILQAVLSDKNGGVADKTINFNFGSQYISAITNSEGIATTEITLNEIPGNYEIETSFEEDEFYFSSSDSDEFEIFKDDTILSTPNGDIVYSDDTTIQVTLYDDENEFLLNQVNSQKTVYLEYFNGTEWKFIAKDALYSTDDTDDILDLYFQIPDNLDEIVENYGLRARFLGDGYYNESVSETGNLEIMKEDAILSDPSATVTYSDSHTLEINFQDDDDETLLHQSDKPKTVYLEIFDGTEWKILSQDILNSVDNSDKTLTFTFEIQEGAPVNLLAGDYDLRVRFDGDSRYNSIVENGTLTIVKETVVIIVEDQEGYFSDTITLKAIVLDNDGEVLYHSPNKVSFAVGGNIVGEDVIDEDGKAEIDWVVDYVPTNLNKIYPITVSFAENEYYLSGEGQGEFILKSAKQLKEDTLTELKTIKSDNKQVQKEIDKAIEDVENSLNSELWIDSSRLDQQQGHKVFDREKQAIKSLLKIIEEKGKHDDSEIMTELQAVINSLIKVDILLAKVVIYDAENIGADDADLQKKIDSEVNKAKEELEKALQELADDNPDKAIDYLKKSWKSAQLAIDFLLDKTNRWRNAFENGV